MRSATVAIKTIERTSVIIFWAQVVTIVALAALYMFFVNKTVWNVVARQNVEKNIVAINSKLSDMEFQYITAKSDINLAKAEQLGFLPAEQTIFVSRDQNNNNVALR